MTPQTLRVQAPSFDELASAYDAAFTTSALGRCLRALVWERLDAALAGSGRVLEIGCGTGEDAVHLALRGIDVLATEPSRRCCGSPPRRQAHGCAQRIDFRCLPMERLGVELAGEQFDGTWSNFGAINCVPRLDAVVADLAALLKPGAPLVWVVIGRHVPWEWAWFLARGERHKAFRRYQHGGTVWRGMRIVYPTPAELARTLQPLLRGDTAARRSASCCRRATPRGGWNARRGSWPRSRTSNARRSAATLAALADHYIFEAGGLPARDA